MVIGREPNKKVSWHDVSAEQCEALQAVREKPAVAVPLQSTSGPTSSFEALVAAPALPAIPSSSSSSCSEALGPFGDGFIPKWEGDGSPPGEGFSQGNLGEGPSRVRPIEGSTGGHFDKFAAKDSLGKGPGLGHSSVDDCV